MKCSQPRKIAPVLAPPAVAMQPLGAAFSDIRRAHRCRLLRASQLPRLSVAQANTGDAGTQPVEDRRAGRTTYRPKSYTELVGDAVEAIRLGLEDGLNRMEVEFPAVSNVDGEAQWEQVLITVVA